MQVVLNSKSLEPPIQIVHTLLGRWNLCHRTGRPVVLIQSEGGVSEFVRV